MHEGERPRRDSTADERFVALVEREHRGLTAASALIVGNRSMAEEIVQDVLERTYRRWKHVDTYDRPGAWVRRAVVNQSISVARRATTERSALDRLRRRRPAGERSVRTAARDLVGRSRAAVEPGEGRRPALRRRPLDRQRRGGDGAERVGREDPPAPGAQRPPATRDRRGDDQMSEHDPDSDDVRDDDVRDDADGTDPIDEHLASAGAALRDGTAPTSGERIITDVLHQDLARARRRSRLVSAAACLLVVAIVGAMALQRSHDANQAASRDDTAEAIVAALPPQPLDPTHVEAGRVGEPVRLVRRAAGPAPSGRRGPRRQPWVRRPRGRHVQGVRPRARVGCH